MTKTEKMVLQQYIDAGYEHVPNARIQLRFKNDFSMHYVFICNNADQLSKEWRVRHKQVIDEYADYEGPSFMDWNYYEVFLVDESFDPSTQSQLIFEIEQEKSYSRKFVRSITEISSLPPGAIRTQDLQKGERSLDNALKSWESTIGERLYQTIVDGPKNRIEERLEGLIREETNA